MIREIIGVSVSQNERAQLLDYVKKVAGSRDGSLTKLTLEKLLDGNTKFGTIAQSNMQEAKATLLKIRKTMALKRLNFV
jgi:hypothetical protein